MVPLNQSKCQTPLIGHLELQLGALERGPKVAKYHASACFHFPTEPIDSLYFYLFSFYSSLFSSPSIDRFLSVTTPVPATSGLLELLCPMLCSNLHQTYSPSTWGYAFLKNIHSPSRPTAGEETKAQPKLQSQNWPRNLGPGGPLCSFNSASSLQAMHVYNILQAHQASVVPGWLRFGLYLGFHILPGHERKNDRANSANPPKWVRVMQDGLQCSLTAASFTNEDCPRHSFCLWCWST